MRCLLLFLSLLAIPLAAPQTLLAHGVPLAGQSLYVVDGQQDHWVYVTNFGAITHEFPDRFYCSDAFLGSETFRIAPLGLRNWAYFTPFQAGYTEDGCFFEDTLALPALPTDIAVDQETDHLAFTVQTQEGPEIWQSLDSGRSFEKLPLDLGLIRPTSLGYLDTDTLILFAYSEEDDSWGSARLLAIDMETLSLEEIPLEEGFRFPSLLDARAGHLIWHARRDNQTEIYWGSLDELTRGAYFTPRWPLSGALAPDGKTAYLGGVDENSRGIFSADYDQPSSWDELLAGHRTLCLTATATGLYACGYRESDGHDLLFIDMDLQLLELVDFRDLQGSRDDCPETSTTAQICPLIWPHVAEELSLELDTPNPAPSVDAERNEPEEEPPSSCSTASGPSSPLALLLFLIVLVRTRRMKLFSPENASPFISLSPVLSSAR